VCTEQCAVRSGRMTDAAIARAGHAERRQDSRRIKATPSGGNIVIDWTRTVLESAPSLTGPWSPVRGRGIRTPFRRRPGVSSSGCAVGAPASQGGHQPPGRAARRRAAPGGEVLCGRARVGLTRGRAAEGGLRRGFSW
jgi:hypothetical protein